MNPTSNLRHIFLKNKTKITEKIFSVRVKKDLNPLFDIIGLSGNADGPRDGSVNHDKYIYNRK